MAWEAHLWFETDSFKAKPLLVNWMVALLWWKPQIDPAVEFRPHLCALIRILVSVIADRNARRWSQRRDCSKTVPSDKRVCVHKLVIA